MSDEIEVLGYFQNPASPEQILGIYDLTQKEKSMMNVVGWKQVFPTFVQNPKPE